MLAPLRRPEFRTLWAGMAISLLGDGVFLVAVAWQAYSISHSPSTLAYVGLATSLPQVAFFLLGGAVSDRLPRRSVLVAADLARAAVLAGLAFMVAARTAHLYELCVTGAVIGTATAFSSPAFEALVPQLVPRAELTEANAIEQFVRPGALQLAGPALGGLAVVALGPAGCFALDSVSFLFSALCAMRLTPLPLPERVSRLRAVSARTMLPRGAIGSRMRRISEAETYLSCTICSSEPSRSPGSGRLPILIFAPTAAWSSGTMR